jgi:hypothetical protein
MEIGAAIFFTDYSITPTALAMALEERGFDSLWVPEHSHIPVSRRFTHPQGEAALTKKYYDVMDPFVALSAAAVVTTPQAGHSRLPRYPARHDPDRQACRFAVPSVEGPLSARHRLRLECPRNGRSRHRIRDPHPSKCASRSRQ